MCPILDYTAEVWDFSKIDSIQNRAERVFLGVHNFAPNAAVSGDTGLTPSRVRRKVAMIRFWNKLLILPNNRIT